MRRFWRAGMLVTALVGALTVAPTLPASADIIPPTQYPPVALSGLTNPTFLLTQPDGGVTVGCNTQGNTAFKTFDTSGNVTQSRLNADPYLNPCPQNMAVGSDGTLYVTAYTNNWNVSVVQAIKNGTINWTYTVPCGGSVQGVVVGVDGNVYMLLHGVHSPCSSQTMLVGVTPTSANSSTPPAVVLSSPLTGLSWPETGGLAAYDGGLVVRTNNGLQYITTSGAVTTHAVNVLPGVYQEMLSAVVSSGRVVVPVGTTPANQQLCGNDTAVVGGLYAYEPSGQVWGYNSLPACSHVYEIRPTPTGGVVVRFLTPQGGIPGSPWVENLLAISASGTLLWQTNLAPNDGQSYAYWASAFQVDLNGNVAVGNFLKYLVNGTQEPAIRFKLLSGTTGIPVSSFELSGPHDSSSAAGYMWTDMQVRIAHNTAYVAANDCTGSWCDSQSTKLYAFQVPGLQMDYPRGAIVSPTVAEQDYAALGDSYSSGEGVTPFVAGTDTSSNKCHRSGGAYGPLMTGTPATKWTFATVSGRSTFAACSGATTQNVLNGQYNEGPQVNVLTTSTKVVTISIGGNDVPFRDLVIDCLFEDCSNPAVNQAYFANIGGLGSSLNNLYNQPGGIHERAPNAKVYVLGYPQLLPTQGCAQTDAWMSAFNSIVQSAHGGNAAAIATLNAIGYLGHIAQSKIDAAIAAGTFEFNTNEVATVRTLVQQLDQAIKNAVTAINQPWLVYVDPLAAGSPFIGHELCTAQPYFNGLDAVNIPYSYHPNGLGQDAYRQLLLQQF